MIAEKDFAGRQIRGARKRQEDAYAFTDIIANGNTVEGLLVVVADGMGGHTSGEQASELALESFVDAFQRASGPLRDRFLKAAHDANDAIAEELKRSPELEGMGTTLLAAGLTSAGVEWISIGDSPLYVWRNKKLTRLNEDHSFRPLLNDMLDAGELTAAEAARHPLKNLLRSALTGGEIDMIDQTDEPLELAAGDIIIAATDGIQSLDDSDIERVVTKYAKVNASVLASSLLEVVLDAENTKQDNTTVAVLKALPGGFQAYPLEAPSQEEKKDTETVILNFLQAEED